MSYVGHVTNSKGIKVQLYARFEVEKPQHEYEITELILAAKPKAVCRGHQVGKYRSDAELMYETQDGIQIVYLEHERTRKSLDRVKERIKKYDGCTSQVRWIVETDARIRNIISVCKPPPNHRFTTFEKAVESWNSPDIWQRNSQKET